jgi:hypothetical protein
MADGIVAVTIKGDIVVADAPAGHSLEKLAYRLVELSDLRRERPGADSPGSR